MEFVVVWLIFGGISAAIASSRGASAAMGFLAGVLLGPIGIGIAFFLEKTAPQKLNTLSWEYRAGQSGPSIGGI